METISEKIEQINSASREQELGISQTSTALSQMNQATSSTNSQAQRSAELSNEIMTVATRINALDRALNLIVTGQEEGEGRSKKTKLSRVDQLFSEDNESFETGTTLEDASLPHVDSSSKGKKLALARSLIEKTESFKKSA